MITKIIIIALLVWAINATMWEGMIFGKLVSYASRIPKIPLWLVKVLFECVICGTMWYGSAIYWIVWHISFEDYILCVTAAMGLNAVLVSYLPKG